MLNNSGIVFLLDVDNTLLDNDQFSADLHARLTADFGDGENARYWSIYESLRNQFGYADYLDALQKFRTDLPDDPKLPWISQFLLEYPFADRFYPHALEAITHLQTLGTPVVLSDGDMVFQPRKIQRSGIWDAVAGQVMITVHKQDCLHVMRKRFPAAHYVMVDDKPKLLAVMKTQMREELTTVFVRQGHYATDAVNASIDPRPDRTIDSIAELRGIDLSSIESLISAAT